MLRRLLDTYLAFVRLPASERAAPIGTKAAAGVIAAIFALFAALTFTNAWRGIEAKGFDSLTVSHAPGKSQMPITLVGIDEPSFAEVGRQWPWPRSVYAKAIDQIAQSGALVIALDILLPEASTTAEDEALARSVAAAGNVVMAADMAFQETAYARQWMRVDPHPLFRQAGATAGLAVVNPDLDTVVRQLPEGQDVFWREIVRRMNAAVPGIVAEPRPPPGALIRYVGPDHSFPYISFYQALAADTHLPPGAFRDQIVIVGRDLKASTDALFGAADTFATPFTSETRGLTPGAEVHANILESAISGRSLVPMPHGQQVALLAALALLAGLLLRRWRPGMSLVIAVGLAASVYAASSWLFAARSLFVPFVGAIGVIVTTYLVFGAIGFIAESRRRAEVRRAFTMYVAPEIVDHVLARPDRLRFGGEKRIITVMFTDLAGFTTISEQHGPEVVAAVLQQHFTRASRIVKGRRGTLTQFIGDAIMAIWNAPLDDPEHAANACLAARELQADLAALRQDLVRQGLPEIRMRVGVNTCEAVVGNLGAEDRFNYTGIGDGINLSARLEGANKAFGTGILVSASTVALLPPGMPLRRVARVIVKGKTEPIPVFTFEDDAGLCALTEEAIAAFAKQDWDGAEAAFGRMRADFPADGLAKHYLARTAELRGAALGTEWDCAVALEKL